MNNFRKIFLTLFLIFSCVFGLENIKAASINISSNTTYVTVGNTFSVTVNISSDAAAWDFSIGYDSSKLRVVSGLVGNSMRAVNTSANYPSRSYTIKFKAIASGNASVYVSDAAIANESEQYLSVSKGSRNFILRTQAEIEASYSKNNYLASLSVEGKELTPAFNKDTMEYSVELEPETTSLNILASVADSKSSVVGTGTVALTDGDNRLEVIVTAQNGSQRTYVINASVKEHDPIVVKVNNKDYTVIRKKSALTAPNNYVETTVKIGENDVPGFKSDITGLILVGLKDEAGTPNLYSYKDGNYTLYKEYSFNKVILYPMELKEIPDNYKATTITYNDEKITAYKIKETSKYALIYGMNVETGETNIYMHDSNEDTLQIYNTEEINILKNQNNLYLKIMIGLSSLSFVLIIISIVRFIKNNKKTEQKENSN